MTQRNRSSSPRPSPDPATDAGARPPSRRAVLHGGAALGGAALVGAGLPPSGAAAAPALVRGGRAGLSHGVASGDVTRSSAVLWARADAPGRLVAQVRHPGRGGGWRTVPGPVVTDDSDLTGTIRLDGLLPGELYEYRLAVETADGAGPSQAGRLRTAPRARSDVSFTWTGDTAGQGWGRRLEDGMPGFGAMLATDPDFVVHSGDTIYADGPIAPEVVLPDGTTWRNVVTDGVEEVAQDLDQFRGRHRYNRGDHHVQALTAAVPLYAQWDDHEVTNNWYPGEVLTDPRYTRERRTDVLAQRGRRAFGEYHPFDDRRRDAEGKVYGRFPRGPHVDLFMLDMRTYRGANTANTQPAAGPETPFLGREQADWFVREARRSRATWKVVLADMPLGVVVPDGSLFEAVANGVDGPPLGRELEIASLLSRLKRARVSGLVWLTADVHWTAAHRYDPAAAGFSDFDPFWEFVAGPIHAGAFPVGELDGTFGPQRVFASGPTAPNESPAGAHQFFGHVAVEGASGAMTVSLRTSRGDVVHAQVLEPT